jgi:hypothetical protein
MMSTIAFRHTSISIGSHYMHSCYCAIQFCLVKVIMLMVQGPFLTCFICDSGPGLGAQYLVYLLCCVLVDHTPYALKGFTRLCAKLFLMGFSPLSVYSRCCVHAPMCLHAVLLLCILSAYMLSRFRAYSVLTCCPAFVLSTYSILASLCTLCVLQYCLSVYELIPWIQ